MRSFKADLHIHSVLSPCGDLEMSPSNIISKAKELGIECLGIADHNCTLNAKLTQRLGKENGIFVLMGAEVTTKEEAHCLCFFEKEEELDAFQTYLDEKLPKIELDEERFGYQLVVNENEEILEMKEYLLISALDADLDEVYNMVHSLNGLFIPAHINKGANSLTSQLGFVPPDIKADGLEISAHITKQAYLKKNAYLKKFQFIQSSDAHYIHLIGETFCYIIAENELSFSEFRLAIAGKEGRYIQTIE